MYTPSPHDKELARSVVISSSMALGLMILDFVLLVRDEIKYVWPRVRTSWTSRIFVVSRYMGLAGQTYNVYFAVRMYLGVYTTPAGCRIWFAYQAVTIQVLLFFAQGLLMHRLYALYLCSRPILVMLYGLGLSQLASMWVSARLSFPSNKHTTTCLMVKSNPANAVFSSMTLTINAVIFLMTFWRYFRLPARWTRGDVGRVVIRDSALSMGAIMVMMLFLTLCSLEVIKPTMSGNITYYWLVLVLWVSIGRIVVNHEKLPRDTDEQVDGNTWKGTLQLTSLIEMGQSVLSLETACGGESSSLSSSAVAAAASDGKTPTSRTLESALSTPMTKASQLEPSKDGSRRWLRVALPVARDPDHDRCGSQPSSTVASPTDRVSRPPSLSTGSRKNEEGVPQVEDRPRSESSERVRRSTPRPPPSARPSPSSSSERIPGESPCESG